MNAQTTRNLITFKIISSIKATIYIIHNNANIYAGCRNSAPFCNNATKILHCYVIALVLQWKWYEPFARWRF